MPNDNRMMINLDPDTMATLKLLSGHTGLPMTTYAKLLIRSGMPAIEPLVEALNTTNQTTARKLQIVTDQLNDMQESGQEGEEIERDLNDEYQYELSEEYNTSTK
jgi:predicted DNA-binding protein